VGSKALPGLARFRGESGVIELRTAPWTPYGEIGTSPRARCSVWMALYFFDTRDNDDFIEDDVGVELTNLEAVKHQAALALTELARDVLPGSTKRNLAVEVRDERGAVMSGKLVFEAIMLVDEGGSS
jgi:hypothetical protein